MKRLTLYISALVLCSISSSAQQDGVFVNGATVSVGSDALLYIDGNIASNGKIDNAGTITLNGNWQSKGLYTNTGIVNFIGDDQIIDNYSNTFNTILIDGGGKKTVPSGFKIGTEMVLSDGVLWPSDTARIIAEENAEVDGGSSYSYVNGMFYNTGVGDKYYPIGKDGTFLPAQMEIYTGSSPVVGYELFNSFPSQPKVYISILDIETDHYWKQNILSGSFDSATLALPFTERQVMDHHAQIILQAPSLDSLFASTGRLYGYESDKLNELSISHIASLKKITGSYFALGLEQLLDVRLRYIPNALSRFAPNPEDRVIKVYGNLFSPRSFSFKVSNQWGNVVFETRNVELMETVGWDGVNPKTGKHEMAGQYHFVFRAFYKTGTLYEEAGALYIIE